MYHQLGDYKRALGYYEKALAINPQAATFRENANVVRALLQKRK